MAALHQDLDQLTDEAMRLAGHYEKTLIALERSRFFPPPEVVPVDGGYRVHLPGRTARSTLQLAQIYATKAEANAALRAIQAGDRDA